MTNRTLPAITLNWNPSNMLESPVHMINWALNEFGPLQAEYTAGHAAIRVITDRITSTSTPAEIASIKLSLNAITDGERFKVAHATGVWAAQTIAAHRRELIRRTDQTRTDTYITKRAAKYGVTALPTQFGPTGL